MYVIAHRYLLVLHDISRVFLRRRLDEIFIRCGGMQEHRSIERMDVVAEATLVYDSVGPDAANREVVSTKSKVFTFHLGL